MAISKSFSSPISMTTKVQWDVSTYEKHELAKLILGYTEAYPALNLVTLEARQRSKEEDMAHVPHRLGQLLEYGMVSSLEDMIHIAKYLAAVAHQIEYAPNYSGGCQTCLDLRLGASLRELMRVEELNNAYGPIFRSSVAIALLRDTAQNLCAEHDEAAQQKVQQERYAREKEESQLGKVARFDLESAVRDEIPRLTHGDWKDL